VVIGIQTVFRGSITALVTPFEDGRFDEARFRALLRLLGCGHETDC